MEKAAFIVILILAINLTLIDAQDKSEDKLKIGIKKRVSSKINKIR